MTSEAELVHLFSLAMQACSTGDLAEAERCFGACIDIRPDFPEYWSRLGVVCFDAGKFGEAVKAFDGAVDLSPDSDVDWTMLALSLYETDELDRAESVLKDLISRSPNPLRHCILGHVQLGMGNDEAAVGSYLESVRLDPGYEEALVSLGLVSRLRGKYEEAHGFYDRAIACDPEYAWAWREKGHAHLAEGTFASAVTALERSTQLDPQDPDALALLVRALQSSGDSVTARRALAVAEASNSGSADLACTARQAATREPMNPR